MVTGLRGMELGGRELERVGVCVIWCVLRYIKLYLMNKISCIIYRKVESGLFVFVEGYL